MGPGIRIDPSRTRRGEIMLGAGAASDDGDEAESDGGESEPAEPVEEASPAS
jgi:hypothetical protein